MWIKRDFLIDFASVLPIKVLKGPRQSGKTSFLERLGDHETIYFDDATTRLQAQQHPRFFLDNLPPKLILDEAPLAPALFPELKRRVDELRRSTDNNRTLDYWITGSNQTLVRQNVSESLAGRASYFDFNTLSIHELGELWSMESAVFRGGWPELYANPRLDHIRYLNDLIATFVERDVATAAGIERKASFTKFLQLLAGRIGQLFNASDIARAAGVDSTTISSWALILEENGIVRQLTPYWSNLNNRLIKSPKYYFEDVALAVRLQGWQEFRPLTTSPLVGSIIENIAISEVSRVFMNKGMKPKLHFLRSKEKVEVNLLIELPNQVFIVAEVKTTPKSYSPSQLSLVNSLNLDIAEHWILSPQEARDFPNAKSVSFREIYSKLSSFL